MDRDLGLGGKRRRSESTPIEDLRRHAEAEAAWAPPVRSTPFVESRVPRLPPPEHGLLMWDGPNLNIPIEGVRRHAWVPPPEYVRSTPFIQSPWVHAPRLPREPGPMMWDGPARQDPPSWPHLLPDAPDDDEDEEDEDDEDDPLTANELSEALWAQTHPNLYESMHNGYPVHENFTTQRMRQANWDPFVEVYQHSDDILDRPRGIGPKGYRGGNIFSDAIRSVQNTAQTAVDTIKAPVDRVINTMSGPRVNWSPPAQKTLDANRDRVITGLTIDRKKVDDNLNTALNVVSGNQWNTARSANNLNDVYHVSLRVFLQGPLILRVEKLAVVTLTELNTNNQTANVDSSQAVPSPCHCTFGVFMDNARKAAGDDKFFLYDAFDNNCQDFVLNLLQSNNCLDAASQTFLKQDFSKVVAAQPGYLQGVAHTLTDLGGMGDRFLNGGRCTIDLFRHIPPKTRFSGGAVTTAPPHPTAVHPHAPVPASAPAVGAPPQMQPDEPDDPKAQQIDAVKNGLQGAIESGTSALEMPSNIVSAVDGLDTALNAGAANSWVAPVANYVGDAIAPVLDTAAPILEGISAASEAIAPVLDVLGPVGQAAGAALLLGLDMYNALTDRKRQDYERSIKTASGDLDKAFFIYEAENQKSGMDSDTRFAVKQYLRDHNVKPTRVVAHKMPSESGIQSTWDNISGFMTGNPEKHNDRVYNEETSINAGVPMSVLHYNSKHGIDPTQKEAPWKPAMYNQMSFVLPNIGVKSMNVDHRPKSNAGYDAMIARTNAKMQKTPAFSLKQTPSAAPPAAAPPAAAPPAAAPSLPSAPPAAVSGRFTGNVNGGDFGKGFRASDVSLGAKKTDAAVAKALSGDEVQKAAGGGIKVLRYPDLREFKTWDEFMDCPAKAAAVLFLVESETSGHWIAVFDAPDGPHVFDPIGIALDAERSRISHSERKQLDENEPQLARLLKTTRGPAHVSRVDYQKDTGGVNTCGRWVALRIRHKHLSDTDFADQVHQAVSASGLTPDAWVATEGALRGGHIHAPPPIKDDDGGVLLGVGSYGATFAAPPLYIYGKHRLPKEKMATKQTTWDEGERELRMGKLVEKVDPEFTFTAPALSIHNLDPYDPELEKYKDDNPHFETRWEDDFDNATSAVLVSPFVRGSRKGGWDVFKAMNKEGKKERLGASVSLMSDVLHKLNKAGIVHCDLHYNNIIWDADARKYKIIDFGISGDDDPKPYNQAATDDIVRLITDTNEDIKFGLNEHLDIDTPALHQWSTEADEFLRDHIDNTHATQRRAAKLANKLHRLIDPAQPTLKFGPEDYNEDSDISDTDWDEEFESREKERGEAYGDEDEEEEAETHAGDKRRRESPDVEGGHIHAPPPIKDDDGGVLLGVGAFGATFAHPPLRVPPQRIPHDRLATKATSRSEADKEREFGSILEHVDPESRFTVPVFNVHDLDREDPQFVEFKRDHQDEHGDADAVAVSKFIKGTPRLETHKFYHLPRDEKVARLKAAGDLMSDVLHKLNYHQIYHNDLHSDNMMWDEEAGNYKLIDWGASQYKGAVDGKAETRPWHHPISYDVFQLMHLTADEAASCIKPGEEWDPRIEDWAHETRTKLGPYMQAHHPLIKQREAALLVNKYQRIFDPTTPHLLFDKEDYSYESARESSDDDDDSDILEITTVGQKRRREEETEEYTGSGYHTEECQKARFKLLEKFIKRKQQTRPTQH